METVRLKRGKLLLAIFLLLEVVCLSYFIIETQCNEISQLIILTAVCILRNFGVYLNINNRIKLAAIEQLFFLLLGGLLVLHLGFDHGIGRPLNLCKTICRTFIFEIFVTFIFTRILTVIFTD